MINKSFNNFIKRKQMTEAAGRAGHLSPAKKRLSSLSLPTSYPGLSSFLNLIHNHDVRRNFLIWIVGEGLMKASIGREKLFKTLKENPQKILKEENLSFEKYQKLKEMARQVGFGREEDRSVITSKDLFSPKARKENEELASISQKIDDYYEKNYEPKEAIINVLSGKHVRIDLELLREKCRELNLPEFKYGGTDGYIEYTEKGDYLRDELKQRDLKEDPNLHFGPDLRPDDKSSDGEGGFLPVVTVHRQTGNHVYNFMGGHYEEVPNQINAILQNMRASYTKAMSNQSTSDGLENFKRFGKKIDIHNFEEFKEYLDNQKGTILNRLGLPDYDEAPDVIPIPDFVSEESFKNLIRNGIEKKYQEISKDLKEKIFNELFLRNGSVKTRLPLKEKISDQFGKDEKVLLSNLLAISLKDEMFLKDLFDQGRLTIYAPAEQSHGPTIFLTSKKSYKLDVNFDNPDDAAMGNEFLEKLIRNGYFWAKDTTIKLKASSRKTKKKKTKKIPIEKKPIINANPFWDKINNKIKENLNKIFLTNNKNYFLVYKDENNNFFIDIPDPSVVDKEFRSKSLLAHPVLGSKENTIRSRSMIDHYYSNPGSKQQYEDLFEQLKRGLLGEHVSLKKNAETLLEPGQDWKKLPILYNDIQDLPSVQRGIKYAMALSKAQHKGLGNWSDFIEEQQGNLLMSAKATLIRISNEKAFQSGWITDEEVDNFKGRIRASGFKSLRRELEDYGLEPDTVGSLESLLEKNRIAGHDIQNSQLRKILGRNAIKYRVSRIGLDGKIMLDREYNKEIKNQNQSLDAPQGNDEGGIAGNVATKGYDDRRSDVANFDYGTTAPLGSDQIRDLIQQHGLTPVEIPKDSKDNIRRPTRVSKPIPKFDPSMIRYKDQSSVAAVPTKDQSSVAAVPTTPKFDPSMIKYKTESFISYNSWKQKNEMAGTYVVSPKKPKDGCGYNIWGAAGKPAVSITGEPIKKKKKNGR